MFKLFFGEYASLELEKAGNWYENKQEGLRDRFLDAIEHCLERIKTDPQLFAKQRGDYRQAVVKTFPFVVIYKIDKDAIIVLSVFHTKRNPRVKYKKNKR